MLRSSVSDCDVPFFVSLFCVCTDVLCCTVLCIWLRCVVLYNVSGQWSWWSAASLIHHPLTPTQGCMFPHTGSQGSPDVLREAFWKHFCLLLLNVFFFFFSNTASRFPSGHTHSVRKTLGCKCDWESGSHLIIY